MKVDTVMSYACCNVKRLLYRASMMARWLIALTMSSGIRNKHVLKPALDNRRLCKAASIAGSDFVGPIRECVYVMGTAFTSRLFR